MLDFVEWNGTVLCGAVLCCDICTAICIQLWHWVVSEVSMGEERFGTHHSKIILAFYPTGQVASIVLWRLTAVQPPLH